MNAGHAYNSTVFYYTFLPLTIHSVEVDYFLTQRNLVSSECHESNHYQVFRIAIRPQKSQQTYKN